MGPRGVVWAESQGPARRWLSCRPSSGGRRWRATPSRTGLGPSKAHLWTFKLPRKIGFFRQTPGDCQFFQGSLEGPGTNKARKKGAVPTGITSWRIQLGLNSFNLRWLSLGVFVFEGTLKRVPSGTGNNNAPPPPPNRVGWGVRPTRSLSSFRHLGPRTVLSRDIFFSGPTPKNPSEKGPKSPNWGGASRRMISIPSPLVFESACWSSEA